LGITQSGILSIWDIILQELVYKGRRESFAKVKDQNVIRHKWHVVDDQTVRQESCAVEKMTAR